MPTTTTRPHDTLQLALDLGNTSWKLGFPVGGSAQPARLRTMPGARAHDQSGRSLRLTIAFIERPSSAASE